MLILGLNAFHGDASACILREGRLIAAVEEERFRRVKHWAGFPSESIRYCLQAAGASLADVDVIAFNQDSGANLARKVGFMLTHRPDLQLVLDRVRNRGKRAGVADELARHFPGERFRGRTQPVEHHLAHLSSAYHASPFEEAVVVSVDGFGDFASAAWGLGRGSRLAVDQRVYFPNSLGIFYEALTQYLGFLHYGDEYKVMGLAPYGQPTYLDQLRKVVLLKQDGSFELDLRFFRHHSQHVSFEWSGGSPEVGRLYSDELVALLGPAREPGAPMTDRHRDLARSVQAMYEEAFFHLLNTLHRSYGVDRLALAGGCAMNSVANGKVRLQTPFRELYVQSAAGDAGGAIGAALSAWYEEQPQAARVVMDHAYWGPEFGAADIASLLQERAVDLQQQGCTVERVSDEAALCEQTARAIADGMVVGWFQGRMEWGPRALGNRSIVCDPRRSDMKDILNSKIKRRESFRPFAPSLLRERVPEWFEQDGDVPFMMEVYQIRAERRAQVPAVTHVDGSGRLQTVTRAANPRYYRLIESFEGQTGVPMVLNTSFNENEPVVCRPAEALDCFLRTRMDLLVLGDYMVHRRAA